jgi:hypothetical protein
MVLGVPVRATVENQSGNKHVESLKIRRLDEGSNPSDSTKTSFKKLIKHLKPLILLISQGFFICENFDVSQLYIVIGRRPSTDQFRFLKLTYLFTSFPNFTP